MSRQTFGRQAAVTLAAVLMSGCLSGSYPMDLEVLPTPETVYIKNREVRHFSQCVVTVNGKYQSEEFDIWPFNGKSIFDGAKAGIRYPPSEQLERLVVECAVVWDDRPGGPPRPLAQKGLWKMVRN